MESTGTDALRVRLAHQRHWRQADAVERGLQPAVDPDGWDLAEIGEGVRLYNVREQHRNVVDGHPAIVTQRLTKRLVDGWWETSYEQESVQYLE